MNIIKNLPNGIRLFSCMHRHTPFFSKIDEFRESGDVKGEQKCIADSTGLWVKDLMRVFDASVNVIGRENIPMDEACVLISNHQGYADIPALFYAMEGKQIGFIAKDALEKAPYFGKWILATRGIYIKRGEPKEALKSIATGVSYLKQGFSLVIFPEGTRSKGPEMGEFKSGSFKLATKAKVKILPISVNGSYHLFEEREVLTKGTTIDVIIHPPIPTDNLNREETIALPEKVEAIIKDGLSQLLEIEKNREANK